MLFFLGLSAALTRVRFQPDFGPIETRNHKATALPFLRLDPRWAVLPPDGKAFSVGLTIANDYVNMQSGNLKVLEKYEYERMLARYRIGLPNQSDLTVDLPVETRGGGFLDPLIDIYHRLILELKDNPRIGLPYGLSEVIVPGSNRFGSAAGVGDVSAVYTKGFGSRLMASLGAKAPTGDRFRILGSGGFDAAFDLQLRIPWGPRFTLDFLAGLDAQSPARYLESTRGLVHQEAICIEKRATAKDNWVFQWQSESAAVQTGISGVDSTNRVLSLGWQHRYNERRSFEAFFTDNGDWLNYRVPELVNVGVEFTCGIRLITKF